MYVIFQVGTVRQQSKVKKDGGTKPAWNQRIQLGLFQASAAPQMLVEVFATSALGKGEIAQHVSGPRWQQLSGVPPMALLSMPERLTWLLAAAPHAQTTIWAALSST